MPRSLRSLGRYLSQLFRKWARTPPTQILRARLEPQLELLEERITPSFGFAVGATGTSGRSYAYAVAADAFGNSYVTGTFTGTENFGGQSLTAQSGNGDAFIAKYSVTGSLDWVVDVGGSGAQASGQGIAVDPSGNVYVTANFQGTVDFPGGSHITSTASGINSSVFVLKLNSSGGFDWADQFAPIDFGYSFANASAITIGPNGNVYSTGWFYGAVNFSGGAGTDDLTTGEQYSSYVSELDPAGQDVLDLALGNGSQAEASTIAVDASGNIFTAGTFQGTGNFNPGTGVDDLTSSAGDYNTFVSKLNSHGQYVFADALGTGASVDSPHLAVDSSGNVYTTAGFSGTGNFSGGSGTDDLSVSSGTALYLSKLGPTGQFVYAYALGSSADVVSSGLTTDGAGNIFIAGQMDGSSGNFSGVGTHDLNSSGGNAFVVELNSSADFATSAQFSTTLFGGDIVVAVDNLGNVDTAGTFSGGGNFNGDGGTDNLTSSEGGSGFSSFDAQQVFGATVDSVTPNAGLLAGGTQATITGDNLATTSTATVDFGSTPGTIVSDNGSTLVVDSPAAQVVGAIDVTVTTANGTSVITPADQFAYVPIVITPASGTVSGGTEVTITGTNLANAAVDFGTVAATDIISDSSTQIVVESPAQAAGTVDVTVTVDNVASSPFMPGGTSVLLSPVQFTYGSGAVPTLTQSASPASGPMSGGTTVTIDGTNFAAAGLVVDFGSVPAPIISFSSTQLIVASPAAPSTGTVDVTVNTSYGTTATFDEFDYTAPPSAVSAQVLGDYIVGAQLVDGNSGNGGIRISQSLSIDDDTGQYYEVNPYFANVAVSGLLAGPAIAGKLTIAESYFNWYLANMSQSEGSAGTIPNFFYDANGNPDPDLPTTASDSDDAYAATFLSAVWAYDEAGGGSSGFFTTAVQGDLQTIAGVILGLQQSNGLTWAKQSYRIEYLEDNCEVYAGLVAISDIEGSVYHDELDAQTYANAAALVQAGIMNNLFNPSTGLFDTSLDVAPVLSQYYPGDQAQAWPIIDGVISAGSPIARNIIGRIDDNFDGDTRQDWNTRTDSASTADAAFLVGDLADAEAAFATASQVFNSSVTPAPDDPGFDVATTTVADAAFLLDQLDPAVSNVNVNSGPLGGGTTVTISGSNLGSTSNATVDFGAAQATIVSDDGFTIVAVSPSAMLAGPVDVTVTTPDGTSATSSDDWFNYVAQASPPSPMQILVPAYFYPTPGGSPWDLLTAAASEVKITAILNPDSGPGSAVDPNYVTAVDNLEAAGGQVIGYVPTGDGTDALATVEAEIDDYSSWYNVDGIFLDQMSSDSGTQDVDYYQTLYQFIHSLNSNWIVIGNPGVAPSETYASTPLADVLVDFEDNGGAYADNVPPSWQSSFPSDQFANIVYDVTSVATMEADVNQAASQNTGIIYVTDANLPNPYDVLPSYWNEFVATVSDVEDISLPYPRVTGVSPAQGPLASGTAVTISGLNLNGATEVEFGGSAASIVSDSATQIVATDPSASSAGQVNVTVTTPEGTSSTSSADLFTYLPAPSVSSVSPVAGPTAGGTTVTISGSNLGSSSDATVQFGSNPATIVSDTGSKIVAVSPGASLAGLVNVIVTTPGGASATSSSDQFTYVAAPVVSSVSPAAGSLTAGTTVTIKGSNLASATAVDFGEDNPATIVSDSATQIVVKAPSSSMPTLVDVTVATAGGTSATSAADQFTYEGVPAITSLSPNSGSMAGGTTVTIGGTNLNGATLVNFGSSGATIVSDSATQLVVTDAAGQVGTIFVAVTSAGGTSADVPAAQFTFVGPPTVTASTSDLGVAASTLVIQGAGFSSTAADDAVTFNGNATGTISHATSTTLTVSDLKGLTGGPLTAIVTCNSISNTAPVQVATVIPIMLRNMADLEANATSLTIYGMGFDSTAANDAVSIDGGITGTVNSATATQLIVGLADPNGLPPGPLTASVTIDGASSAAMQVATVAPVVSATPGNILPANAATITIDGFGFSSVPASDVVKFTGGVTGKVAGATATALTVTKLSGLFTGGLSASVTVSGITSGAAVPVATVTPAIAISTANLAANAATLVIRGVGFSSVAADDTVTFANGAAGRITHATTTTLTVKELAGLTVGPLNATVTSNSENSSTAQVATVIPVLTSSKASLGVDAVSLTINGFGFDGSAANDSIFFNGGVTGTVSSAAANQLIVTFAVPNGLTLGSLTASAEVDGVRNFAMVQVATVVPVVSATPTNPLPANATTLTIDGFGFSTVPSKDAVTFSNGVKGKVTAATSMILTITGLSGLTAGNLLASVSVAGLSSGAAVPVATVAPVVMPNLADLAANATELVIHGFGFSTTATDDTVTFAGDVTGIVTHATNNTLTVKDLTGLTAGPLSAIVICNGVGSGTDQDVATIT